MKQIIEQYCLQVDEGSAAVSHTAGTLARSALTYVQSVGNYKVRPPYYTERTNLPSFLLLYTVSGRGQLTTDGGVETMAPGTCAFVNCMDFHRYEPKGPEQWDFLWTHFYGNSVAGCHQEFLKAGRHVAEVPDGDRFAGILRDIYRLQKEYGIRGELEVNQLFAELLKDLLLGSGCSGRQEAAWPDYVRRTMDRIDGGYGQPLTLDQLALEAGVSKYHLSREFHRWVGVHLTDYLLQIRLNRAKELLSFTDRPVSEVAQTCGFRDTSYFIRIFRDHEDSCTPLAYRRRWQ